MRCSDERENAFPFDIRHRSIITYKTQAPSDFTNLSKSITNKITAILEKRITLEEIDSTPSILKEREGISDSERFSLAIIMANQLTDTDSVGLHTLKLEMDKEGYTDLATSIALRKLRAKEMLEMSLESNYNNQEYHVVKLLKKGEEWMINHEEEFILKVEKVKDIVNHTFVPIVSDDDDDLPF